MCVCMLIYVCACMLVYLCVCLYACLLLVMWETFSSFFRTLSMREDVWSISSPKSPSMLRGTQTESAATDSQPTHNSDLLVCRPVLWE